MLEWFKKLLQSRDLKDLDGEEEISSKDIDQLVKKHTSSKKKTSNISQKIQDKIKSQRDKREDRKAVKKEHYGEITTEDIAKKRRKAFANYLWKGLGVTFAVMVLIAIWTVATMDTPTAATKIKKQKILDGISTEDADYFQSLTSAQLNELAGQIKKIETETKEKENAIHKALLAEEEKNKKLQKKIEKLEAEAKAKEKENKDYSETLIAIIEDKFKMLKDELSSKENRPPDASHKISPMPSRGYDQDVDILVNKPEDRSRIPENNLTKKEKDEIKEKLAVATEAIQEEAQYENITIQTLNVDESIDDGNTAGEEDKVPPLHLMTGFAKATLITGVDAPTFGGGKSNPVPVILSLNTNQIIANGYDADIKDCMLIGQAFGNMNSMRVEIEVTRLSCNMKVDGQMYKIEEAVKGWVYGENGVHGLKGRLVDSSGKIITREIAVGFLEGVATAFAQPNTTVQTMGGIPSQIFTQQTGKDAMYRGLATGTNTALTGLAEYYKKLLDGAYPVISIRSGRNVTVLFKGGEQIKATPYTRVNVSNVDDRYSEEESVEIDVNGW